MTPLQKLDLPRFLRGLLRILRARPRVPPSLVDNALLRVILERRSVRSFGRQEIPADVFAAILEAGRLAPSTVNLQTWSFVVFTPATWQEVFNHPLPFHGQRAVIVLGDTHRDKVVLDAFPTSRLVEYTVAVMNASLAAMNMNMAAEALGVSSVMLSETGRSGFLDAAYLKDKLGLPEGVFPLMTIVFGYARGRRLPMPPRLPLAQVCFERRYQEPDRAIMQDWLDQMMAGYKAAFPRSSFEAQLQLYRSKIARAETDLRAMILREDADQPTAESDG